MEDPYKLFEAVRAKYRKVTFMPVGFPLSTRNEPNFNNFQFSVVGHGRSAGPHSLLNVKLAQLRFTFDYDWQKRQDPGGQMDDAAWAAIMAGPFKNRAFYADPRDETTARAYLGDNALGGLPVKLSHDGPQIPGLTLNDVVAESWDCLIPRKSPEGQAIDLALTLKRAKRMAKIGGTQGNPLIETLAARLASQVEKLAPAP